ncbi:MAG: VOC family protein [Actinomycetota bacterium]|nr:VOC family protein [Actinomycetota bacterium]
MQTKALDHIAVTVSDTRRALDFYCGLLGLQQVEQHQLAAEDVKKANAIDNARGQSTRLIAPGTPGVLIDLLEFFELPKDSAAVRPGIVGATHFALSVENLNEAYEELLSKGVIFDAEPATFPLETGSVTVVFLSDPDGNSIELVDESSH